MEKVEQARFTLRPSNSYAFSTSSHGIRRRSAASASRARVNAAMGGEQLSASLVVGMVVITSAVALVSSAPREVAPMIIRKATDADLAGVSACLAEAFEAHRPRYTPGAFTDTVLTIETARRRLERMIILIADDRGSIAGTIAYEMAAAGEGHLRGMAVRVASQGSGIAAQLLTAAEAGLRDAGCTRVTLDTTRPLERAISFYQRHGYTPTGVIRDFYGMELIEYDKLLGR